MHKPRASIKKMASRPIVKRAGHRMRGRKGMRK